jgi:hypothetical protein
MHDFDYPPEVVEVWQHSMMHKKIHQSHGVAAKTSPKHWEPTQMLMDLVKFSNCLSQSLQAVEANPMEGVPSLLWIHTFLGRWGLWKQVEDKTKSTYPSE